MTTETIIKKQTVILKNLTEELINIKKQLNKLLFIIPEESIKDYKNSSQIKKAYLEVTKNFPPLKL